MIPLSGGRLAAYIDHLIMFLAGVYATGVGYGWLASPARGLSAAEWHRRFGRLFRVIGPMLLSISVLLAFATYLRSAQAGG